MNLHDNKAQARAMETLIHDTNSQLSVLRQMIKRLNKWNNANVSMMNDSEPFIIEQYLISAETKIKEVIDLYHHRFKNDFFECPVCRAVKGHTKECTYLENQ